MSVLFHVAHGVEILTRYHQQPLDEAILEALLRNNKGISKLFRMTAGDLTVRSGFSKKCFSEEP